MRILAMIVALALATPALAEPPSSAPAATAAKYSTDATSLGVLMADPAARAVLARHIPQLIEKDDVLERASGMTLKEIQDALRAFSPDVLSDAVLAKIDQDFAGLPAGG